MGGRAYQSVLGSREDVRGRPVVQRQHPDEVWPEAQRAFLQDGPGLLLTLDQREAFLALDDAGRDAFIGEMLGRDPIPETPANELVEGIARRRRLVAAEPQTLLPLDARAQLLFLRGRPTERIVLDCAAIFKPMEIWAYPGDDGTPRDIVLYRPAAISGARWPWDIPVEDFGFAFAMITLTLALWERVRSASEPKASGEAHP